MMWMEVVQMPPMQGIVPVGLHICEPLLLSLGNDQLGSGMCTRTGAAGGIAMMVSEQHALNALYARRPQRSRRAAVTDLDEYGSRRVADDPHIDGVA